MSNTVLVKWTPDARRYHRMDDDGTPACREGDKTDASDWKEWDRDEADAWKSPCRFPECYDMVREPEESTRYPV